MGIGKGNSSAVKIFRPTNQRPQNFDAEEDFNDYDGKELQQPDVASKGISRDKGTSKGKPGKPKRTLRRNNQRYINDDSLDKGSKATSASKDIAEGTKPGKVVADSKISQDKGISAEGTING